MTSQQFEALPPVQRAVIWYPPRYDIRVEDDVAVPKIEHPDDAIVKVKLGGLCGSDLHVYRGHEDVDRPCVCGHEFIGTVAALGSSFKSDATGRPRLYASLSLGDKVLSPFTVTCGECRFCRLGFTCRCVHSALFGTPSLPGGQAQYIRVPKAGGTLVRTSEADLEGIKDASLLLLGDILPTGTFAALQALQHPKLQPALTGSTYPMLGGTEIHSVASMVAKDQVLTFAVIGLGPVGLCAVVALLHLLRPHKLPFKVVAVDLLPARREKMNAVYTVLDEDIKKGGQFTSASPDEAKKVIKEWTDDEGCNAVLEVVGHNSALSLAYDLVAPFGIISSVGVHQAPPLPFTGREVYDKNVSFDFGRCPVRAVLPQALEILRARQDVFGGVGGPANIVERVVNMSEAPEWYAKFDKGECGKILFDPWA